MPKIASGPPPIPIPIPAAPAGSGTISPIQFALDPVLSAAWLYYEEGLKQETIANQFGISRASVFNLLQRARDDGVVTVSIDLQRMDLLRLAKEVRDRTGVAECFVVPSRGGDEPLSTRIARIGARLLERRLDNESILGVAWGRTVMALSQLMTPIDLPGATIAQVTGSSIATYDFSPELCTSNIAVKVNGRSVNLHAPGIVSSAKMKTLLMREPILEQHFRLLRSCTMTLFGVTNVGSETLLKDSGFMSAQILDDYRKRGAVGFVSGYFFDKSGRAVRTELDDRHIVMPREDFLQVPVRLCVGGGIEKIEAVACMIRGGYANVLVTDEDTARGVLGFF
jgi:dihydroxyacetone kinase-like protein